MGVFIMKRVMLLFCLLIFLFYSLNHAELTERAFRFSSLFSNSDLIVVGIVEDVKTEQSAYLMNFKIENCIGESIINDKIEILTPIANGFYIPDEPYLEKNNRYLLFLIFEENVWKVTNHTAGVLNPELETDVSKIFKSYQTNQNLFSKDYSKLLQSLFFSCEKNESKIRLLYDLKQYLTIEDESFLSSLFRSDNNQYQIFSILQCGKLNIESMRTRIENLLKKSSDSVIKFHCIVALGDLKNPESLPLVLNYINSEDQGTRRASIESAGKIRSNNIVQPLKELYLSEKDIGNRLSIITAISRLSDENLVINTLNYFNSIENNSLVSSILINRINSININR